MGKSIEFVKDFAGYKKGDVTDKVNNQIVSSLKTRGIAKDHKEKVKTKQAPKKEVVKEEKPIKKAPKKAV